MKKQLLFLTMLFIASTGYSQTTFVNNFITYQVTTEFTNNPKVKIISYNIAGGTNVTIPSSVSFNSINHTVTGIDDNAFLNKGLTMVSIPNTVTFINNSAFQGNALTSGVVIPNSVTQLGILCFTSAQLTSIVLSTNLTAIPLGAFQSNNLTTLVIPNSVTSIGNNAFFGNQLTSLTIPSSVTSIGNLAFQNNNQLTSVSFSQGLISIGNSAFLNCQLTNVTIPSTVTSIGSGAFINSSLSNVYSLATSPPTITTTPGNGATDSFAAIRTGIHLHIPPGTLSAYTNASWTGFNPVTQDATLSTSSFELANDIKLITSSETIKIVTSNHIKLENYTMYTMSGAIIASGNSSEISTSFFARGIYIIKLNFDKGSVVKKISVN